jgi:hypothetical protein
MFGEYIGSLMAPWRRINRIEFALALSILSAPGVILMALGFMHSTSGVMSGFQALNHFAQGGEIGSIETIINHAKGAVAPAATAAPQVNLPALLNALCLLILYPFVRGRFLDMGYALRRATLLAVVVQISVLNDVLAAMVGAGNGPLPMAWAFGILTFVAYVGLTVAGSRARKMHDRGPSKHSQLDDDFPPP